MAIPAMSPGNGYDQLWKQSSLDGTRQVQRSLHSDAAAKVEELRSLIGDKFRDLLQTTDSIGKMKHELDSANQDINALHCLFDNITGLISAAKLSATETNISEEKARDRLQQLKKDQTTVLFAAEHVWEGLDTGRLQYCVDVYHQGIEAFDRLDNPTAPLWLYHSELLRDLPRQIKQACYDRLIHANESLRDEDAFRASAAVDYLDWEDALIRFLDCRFCCVQQLIASGDEHGRIAYTLRLTLSECYNWFGEPEKICALGQSLVKELVTDWFQNSVRDLLLDRFPDVVLSYQGDKLASVRDQILKVLFQDNTNSWPVSAQYCLDLDVEQLWQSLFYCSFEKALLYQALHMFDGISNQVGEYLQELEPSITKLCDEFQPSFAVHHRRNSTFWRQIVELNHTSTSDPYHVLIESTGERFASSLRSLSQTSHALLDVSIASSFNITALASLISNDVRSNLERSCSEALFRVADCLESLVSESNNANRSVLFARILRQFRSSVVYVKSLLNTEKSDAIETRFQAICLKAYQLWTNANAVSITTTLRERIVETFQVWKLLECEQFLPPSSWAAVGDVQVPCNASPFAMLFLYDLNRQMQTLHCAEFDGFINAHICAGISVQVATIVSDTLDFVKLLPQSDKTQFLFDVLFIFGKISVPSHVLTSYGISAESSESVAAAIRALRCLMEPVALATSDMAMRESVRLQSARCAIMFGSILHSLPSSNVKALSQSVNRVVNLVPLLSREAPRLPSLPVNLYAARELKRHDLNDDLADSESQLGNIMSAASPSSIPISKLESRSGLSSGVATSATKWLADASFGISTATSGLLFCGL